MVNHSHLANCTFHIYNQFCSYDSYFDAEKNLCDFSLITGVKELGFKTIPSQDIPYSEQIKDVEIWQIPYEDELWEDEDDQSCKDDSDFTYLKDCNKDETYFVMVTTKSVDVGEQLYITYGSRSNANLLLQYGFCYPDNPYDYCELERDGVCYYLKHDRLNSEVLALLRG